MADIAGDGNVDICLVSPSDQAGQINNLLDRVHNLEVAVATLAGLDVNASNLSDMVASLGTITNGTIIMPDNSLSGWTNSIPPGDFSGTIISNGIITTWNNGVVSFEVLPSGISVGGGSSSFAQLSISTSTNTVNSITEAIDADGIVTVSSPTITIASAGTYLFGLKTNFTITCTGSQYGGIDIYDASLSLTPGDSTVASAYHATSGSLSSKLVRMGSCVVATIPSASFDLTVQAVASATTFTGSSTFSILKLS